MFKCSKESKRMGATCLELDMFYSTRELGVYSTNLGFRTLVFTAPDVYSASLAKYWFLLLQDLDPAHVKQGFQ